MLSRSPRSMVVPLLALAARAAPAAPAAVAALVAVAAVAAVAALPLASAQDGSLDGEPLCIIFVTPYEAFTEIEIAVDLILTDEDLSNVSREVDADDDGNVTRDEIDAYEVGSVVSISWEELGEKRLLVDNARPDTVLFGKRLTGFEGNATAERKRVLTEVRTYAFRNVDASAEVHELRGGPGADYRPTTPPNPSPVVETVVFRSPSGWMVWSVNATLFQKEEVTIRGFETKEPFTVRYAVLGYGARNDDQAGGWWIPAPSSLVGGLAIVSAAIALRRVRRGTE